MTQERWRRMKAAYEAALDQPLEKRDECVRGFCREDSQLEAEVKALLEANDAAHDFLQTPAAAVIGYAPPDGGVRTLVSGEVLAGRFEISRFLNCGGMGEVYEAWDHELQDHIALKTIRHEIASSPAVLERFKQEVKRARGISHPNVCRVYDLFHHVEGSGNTIWFLTMELLRGQSLAEWLRSHGPMKPDKALELVKQMVAGLAAAHELGIVHRDFKTGNVMLVDAGKDKLRAVITDFGLALNVREDDGLYIASQSGTPDYMAPEQSRGEPAGFAADQFSLGIVMSEILSGCRPERAGGRITLPAKRHFPLRWAAAIRRCLQTRPQDRFAGITNVIFALDPPGRRNTRWWIGIAAPSIVAGVLLIGMAGGNSTDRTQVPITDRIQAPIKVTSETDLSINPSLSRDGKTLAYISDGAGDGSADIWVQHLPVTSTPVRVTTGAMPDRFISISPDGTVVAFRSRRDGGIYLANTTGGGERLLARDGREPKFSPDGQRILYWKGNSNETVPSGQLYVISVTGGPPMRVAGNFQDARHGVWSPNGQYILFTGCAEINQPLETCGEWWVSGMDGKRVENTGALALLRNQGISIFSDAAGAWYKDGVVFSGFRNNIGSLWEIHLSLRDLRVSGPATQLTSGSNREVNPSLADDGTIAYEHLIGALHISRIENALSPNSIPTRITDDAGIDAYPFVSHNGRWLAFVRYPDAGEGDHIEIQDLDLGNVVRALGPYSYPAYPVIDDSGTTTVFEARQDNVRGIFIAIRGGPARLLCSGCNSPTSWFDGSRSILYQEGVPSKIKITYLETGKSKTLLENRDLYLAGASWSRENQYLLFTAAAGSNSRVYAVRLSGSTGKVGEKWIPITAESEWSDGPRWAGDGRTVFYVSNRDGYNCIWGRHFDPKSGKTRGVPFAVIHYHNSKLSPAHVGKGFGVATAGNSIYLNPGEQSGPIWIGKLKAANRHTFFDRFW